MAMKSKIQGLLFDMGGVVFEIDFERAINTWSKWSDLGIDELRNRFEMDAPYQMHERGEIGASEYFTHLRNRLNLDAEDDEISIGWNSIYLDEITSTIEYISKASTKMPCFAFTNSNPTHQKYWESQYPRAVKCFNRVFVSSDLGLRKPEREAFEAISNKVGINLSNMLFFDDSEENINGAQEAGMQAVLVKSDRDVKRALENIGAL